MRTTKSNSSSSSSSLAAVFLDYQNLHDVIEERVEQSTPPNQYIIDVLSELRRYLLDADGTRVVQSIAYADFATFDGDRVDTERELFSQGTEPRYVPSHAESYTSELQLCVDVMETLYRRDEISTFVLISGNREYYPLVRKLSVYGRNVIVAALQSPNAKQASMQVEGDVYLDMMNLLSDDGRRTLLRNIQANPGDDVARETAFSSLESDISLETLKIAEEYFGQYEEIYLTPLLRKLSELLGSQYDPKSIISELEDAGAVRLEKREGYPYNYTVLIINEDHPDVIDIHDAFYTDSQYGAHQPSYDHDDFQEDGYHTDGHDEGEHADEYLTHDGDEDIEPEEYAPASTDGAQSDEENEAPGNASRYWEEETQV